MHHDIPYERNDPVDRYGSGEGKFDWKKRPQHNCNTACSQAAASQIPQTEPAVQKRKQDDQEDRE